MKYRLVTQLVALIVVVVFTGGIWAVGDTVNVEWLQFYSWAVLLATLALNLWEWFGWRNRLIQRLRTVPRDVRGTWMGELRSFWEDGETGEQPQPKIVYLVVRQTASTISVVLFTDEAKSHSTLGRVRTKTDIPILEYLYEGRPDSRVEDRSRAHRGTAELDIVGRPAKRLKGRYWTDRGSRGELAFSSRDKYLADDYESAASLFA